MRNKWSGLVCALFLCSCAALRGYSDEEAKRVNSVGVYGDEQEMRDAAASISDNYECQFLGVMTGTSGYGSYSESERRLTGVRGTYNDALFFARITALRNGANAIVVKQSFPSKFRIESVNDYIYTLNAHGYKCTGDLKSSEN